MDPQGGKDGGLSMICRSFRMEQTKVLIGNVGREQYKNGWQGWGCIDRVRTVVRDGPLGLFDDT
jgi:hypothetical protein